MFSGASANICHSNPCWEQLLRKMLNTFASLNKQLHLLHLGSDVIQTEVGGQRWSPVLARGGSHGAGR